MYIEALFLILFFVPHANIFMIINHPMIVRTLELKWKYLVSMSSHKVVKFLRIFNMINLNSIRLMVKKNLVISFFEDGYEDPK